jgi:trimethylamine--corrinoid protein Co-methyltransferase
MLTAAALSGVHVGLHNCGTYGSMLAMSYEKFIADEDLCGALKQLMQPVELTDDAFAIDLIKEMGTSGNYLMQPHTLKRCRDEFFIPDLGIRTLHNNWLVMEKREIAARARHLVEDRLAGYEKPDIPANLEKGLMQYVRRRKHDC